MTGVVGVKFETSSKVYAFRAEGLEVKKGDRVVVESELGMGLGRVVALDFEGASPGRELKPILRRATDEDLEKEAENCALGREAMLYCNERIMARGLPMKLVSTEVTLDRKRIIFYFVADNRIDFRELVKDLASKFRTRIELRQIGVRDSAMIVGGLGMCGQEFCCRRFLKSFSPVSIKMAKHQDLVLNTAKLSGGCGRLLCCLSYEYEGYPGRRSSQKSRAEAREEEPTAGAMAGAEEEATADTSVPPADMTVPPPAEPLAPSEGTKGAAAEGRAEARPAQAGGDAEGRGRKRRRSRRRRFRHKKDKQ